MSRKDAKPEGVPALGVQATINHKRAVIYVLADMVRTDSHQLRPAAGDSPEAKAVKVLARARKTLIWERTRAVQRLRRQLLGYFPAALEAFEDLDTPDTLELLGKAARAGGGAFGRHPDAEIILSQPGLGPVLGARVLAEFGDAPPLPRRQGTAELRRHQLRHPRVGQEEGRRRPVHPQ